MKAWIIFLGCCLAGSLAAYAQIIKVELLSEQDRFLPNEKLVLSVSIENQSGQTLTFGQDEQWLQFVIEKSDRRPVSPSRHMPVATKEPFLSPTATSSKLRYDLAPYFDLSETGTYIVTALVRSKEWAQPFVSGRKRIEIAKGVVKEELQFGVPGGGAGVPEIRKYAMEVLAGGTNFKATKRLYVRTSNASGSMVYGVEPIGTFLGFSNLENKLVDQKGQLHLLYQNGADNYLRAIISPEGETVLRRNYVMVSRSPLRLKVSATGEVTVAGGVPRAAADDFSQ